MSLTLARVVVSVMIFCAPFLLFVALSANPENAIVLLFPMLGAIPAIVAALVLFVPAERLLDRIGRPGLKTIVIPLIGASIVYVTLFVLAWVQGRLDTLFRNFSDNPAMFIGVLGLWAFLGVLWGLVWRMTEWLSFRLRLVRR